MLSALFAPRADSSTEIASRPEAWMPGGGTFSKTMSGERIGPTKAMTYSAWFACIRNIAEDVAKCPVEIFEKMPNGSQMLATAHQLYWLLRLEPNPDMVASVFRELMTMWALGWGNAYAEIERDGSGKPVALWPIHPSRCELKREKGKIVLHVNVADSYGANSLVKLDYQDVIHLRGPGDDPLVGLSMARIAAESIGVALAAQNFGATFFSNGAMASVVLVHPNKLDEKGQTNLRESWRKRLSGGNKNGIAVLWDGIKVERMSVSPDEAQFLETRQFQVSEICRWFRMPPHLVQDLSRSTNNNIEHQGIEYLTNTLSPWMNRWEQEFERKLLDRRDWERYDIRHDDRALTRGDSKTRAEYTTKMVSGGLLTINEGRKLERQNPDPSPSANLLWMNGTMQPIERLAAAPAPAPANPEPAPQEDPEDDKPAEFAAKYNDEGTLIGIAEVR